MKIITMKMLIISLVISVLVSGLMCRSANEDYNKEIIRLEKEIDILKESTIEVNNEIKSEVEKEIEISKNNGPVSNNESNKEEENSYDKEDLAKVVELMYSSSRVLNEIYNKITETGTFSGLQDGFNKAYNYGSELIKIGSNLDLSQLNADSTVITNIGYELQQISDSNDMVQSSLDTMNKIMDFINSIGVNH